MTVPAASALSERVSASGVEPSPPVGRRDLNTKKLARLGWAFSAPAMLVVGAVTIFPIVFSVVLSLSHVAITGNGFVLGGFTLGNYRALLNSGRWRYDLGFTFGYTVVTVLVELIIGTAFALVLERLQAARGMMMALLLIPWSMITVISAELWSYIYNGTYGVLNAIVAPFVSHPIVFLGTPVSAIIAMMVADIWKTTPFVTIIVLAGLVMLPDDLYEAAEVDGASGWSTFWKVTFPLLRPTLALAVLFRVLQAFGLFDLPYVLTSGAPGHATESLALLGYEVMFSYFQFGPGAAIAASTALIVLVVCLAFLKVFRSQIGSEA